VKSKEPVTFSKPEKLMAWMDDELKMDKSASTTSTELKSKLATWSPVISILPSKVGHEFKFSTAEAAERVVEREQEFEEEEAAATNLARIANTREFNNIASE